MTDMILFAASFFYFWVVMFDTYPRRCAVLAGLILFGTSGLVMRPESQEFFTHVTAIAFAALLFGRAWFLWRDTDDEL